MKIKKRDGSLVNLDLKQIRKQTESAVEGLNNVSFEEIELNAQISFKDGMNTENIQNLLIKSALNLIDVDKPNATYAASRLHMYDMYHKIKRTYFGSKVGGDVYKAISFTKYMNFNQNHLSWFDEKIIKYFDWEKINDSIVPKRDKLFNYLAIKMLEERYLLRQDIDGSDIVTELPQHMFMSLAIFAAQNQKNPTKKAIEWYNIFSKLEALPGTPTLKNGRTINGNCFSCAIGSMPDNLEGIFDSYKTMALGSKFGSGWGYDISKLRANGGTIQRIKGAAKGPIPFLKVVNDLSIAVDQLGSRLAAINTTMETWHLDIEDFIDLKRNGGEDKRRAKELFISVSCSDLFMNRVENNEYFTLFDPYDVPELTETYGKEFENHYLRYEGMTKEQPEYFTNTPKTIKAKDLWKKIQAMYWDTGMPFIFFKDNANRTKEEEWDYKDVGLIRSPNLCMEQLSPIKDDEINLCNLGSVNLGRFDFTTDLGRKHFTDVTYSMFEFLDAITDVTTYKIPNSKQKQLETRSVGLGLAGEAELLAKIQIEYGSDKHMKIIDKIYSQFKNVTDNCSSDLAHNSNKHCKYSKQKLKNLHRRCIAPTSSISIIMDTTPSVEPIFDRVWIEENKLGKFKVVVPSLSPETWNYYQNAYDIDQKALIRATATRQKYIDMGISHNIYFRPETITGKEVFDILMYAWKQGLKTTYYMRTKSQKMEVEVRDRDSEIACVGCSG